VEKNRQVGGNSAIKKRAHASDSGKTFWESAMASTHSRPQTRLRQHTPGVVVLFVTAADNTWIKGEAYLKRLNH
jgi:hypothetical protein